MIERLLGLSDEELRHVPSGDTITRIKAATIRELQGLDSRMRVHSTDYFNHTFAPDLVLSWPRQDAAERLVYLRATGDRQYLADDVQRVGPSTAPIIIGLDRLGTEGRDIPDGARRLEAVSLETDTLVTDTEALARVAERRQDRPISTLFTGALAQAGRGVLDQDNAVEVAEVVADGFDSARRFGTEAVEHANAALLDHLAPPMAARFSRVLQAVWIGAGGRADLFPGQPALSTHLDDLSLDYLLDLEDVDNSEFWYRIGRSVTLSQVGRLRPQDPSANLQHLMKSNLDHLWGRVIRVQGRERDLVEPGYEDGLRWLVERGTVALRGSDWVAYVAEKTDSLAHVSGESSVGVTIEELRDRLRARATLTSVQLSDGREEVDFASLVNENVVNSDRLGQLAESFSGGARVQRAHASLPTGRQMNLDFTRASAAGVTRSQLPVTELLGVGVPLLHPLSFDESASLREVLTPAGGPVDLQLFTEQDDEEHPLF